MFGLKYNIIKSVMPLLILFLLVMSSNAQERANKKKFILKDKKAWPSQVIFDTVHVCYQGTVKWIVTGNPQLWNQPIPYEYARSMTVHCFCVLDQLRQQYTWPEYANLISVDVEQDLGELFMEKSIKCVKEYNTLPGLVILDKLDSDNSTKKEKGKRMDNSTNTESPDQKQKLEETPQKPQTINF